MTGRLAVLGSTGLLGPAVVDHFNAAGWVVIEGRRPGVDAADPRSVGQWLGAAAPDVLLVCAAMTGGVADNLARPADFMARNLAIATASLVTARAFKGLRVIYCSSAAAYGDPAPEPLREADLGGWPAESSHPGYGAAKLAGAQLCQLVRRQDSADWCALMLGNLYGLDPRQRGERANVIPALVGRFREARRIGADSVSVWGTGAARRSFLHVRDAARALALVLDVGLPEDGVLNLAGAREVSIADLASKVARACRFDGEIIFDAGKPDGRSSRRLDLTRLTAMGFEEVVALEDGLEALAAAH